VRFVDEIDAGVLKAFQDGMARQKLASKTIRNRMLILSFLLKHAGVGTKVNWQDAPVVEEQAVRAFSNAELRKLFDACSTEENAVFSFFLGTGCREQEVSHAEWSDIDWQHHTFTVQEKPEWGFTPKSHEARQIPVPAELLTLLKAHKKTADEGQPLIFPNQGRQTQRTLPANAETCCPSYGFELRSVHPHHQTPEPQGKRQKV
jgi:integrase